MSARFQQFPGKNFRKLTTTSSAGKLGTFGVVCNIFSVDEILLEFFMVIITAIIRARPSPTVTPFETQHAKNIRQCPADASRSSRKWSIPYNIRKTFERFVVPLLCYSMKGSMKLCTLQYVGVTSDTVILHFDCYAMNIYGYQRPRYIDSSGTLL